MRSRWVPVCCAQFWQLLETVRAPIRIHSTRRIVPFAKRRQGHYRITMRWFIDNRNLRDVRRRAVQAGCVLCMEAPTRGRSLESRFGL